MTGGRICHFLGAAALQLALMRAIQNALSIGWVLILGGVCLVSLYGIAWVWEYQIQGWIARTFTFAGWNPRPDWYSVAVVPFGALGGTIAWIWLPW